MKYFKNNIPSKVRSGGAVVGNVFSGVKNKLVGLARSVSETDIHAVTEAVLSQMKKSGTALKKAVSRMANNRVSNSYKRQIAVLMVLAIFLATGMMDTISAAIPPDDGQASDLVPAYKVYLDGTDLCYVSDPAIVRTAMDETLQDAEEQYGMAVSSGQKLSFQETFIAPVRISQRNDVVQAIHEQVHVKVDAYTLYADGEPIGVLKSREEAEKVLDTVQSQYVGEAGKPESVEFQEEVQVRFTQVPFAQVQDADAVLAEIAKGRETVEEYTITEGDNLWTISRAYDMDVETLAAMNSDIQDLDKLKLGQKIRLSYPKSPLNVVTTEVARYEETIAFETETRQDDSLYKNQTKILQEGADGRKQVEARVKKVNGVEEGREILSEQVTQEPVKKVVVNGTKTLMAMASRGGGALLWPARGSLSSGFGKRWGRMHEGIDIANSSGTPVYAADPGKVTFAGRSNGYGNFIKINHGGGLVTCYGHLKSFAISSGQSVERGQLIGYMGSTGRSTGPHLHFEVRVNGSAQNPRKYLP